jgi:hypothetical protein
MGISTGAALLGSAVIGGVASKSAADTQAQAGQASIAAQQGMFDTTQKNIAPTIAAGTNALGQIGQQQDYFNHQFGPADLKAGLAPNYDFMRTQGLVAANNAAGVSGAIAGGNAQQGGINYAENYAGNAYQNAFNNYQTQKNDIFNRLSSIASLGANSAVGQGTIGANVGSNIGNTITGIGNAQAGGTVGAANAITGGVGNYLGYNWLTNQGNTSGTNYLGTPNVAPSASPDLSYTGQVPIVPPLTPG